MSNIEKDSPINKFITNEFPQQSSLISRLQQFIPQLSAANQRLKQDGTKTDSGITIESVAKDESDLDSDSESEGPRIEFDLHVINDDEKEETPDPKKFIEEI